MTNKTFSSDEFIQSSTRLVNDLNNYLDNDKPSPELVDAMKGLYSDLLGFSDKLENLEDGDT